MMMPPGEMPPPGTNAPGQGTTGRRSVLDRSTHQKGRPEKIILTTLLKPSVIVSPLFILLFLITPSVPITAFCLDARLHGRRRRPVRELDAPPPGP